MAVKKKGKSVKKKAPSKKEPKEKKEPKQTKNTGDYDKDAQILAKPVGKRISANGNVYYEYRSNRSDTEEERTWHGGGDIPNGDHHRDSRKKTKPVVSKGFLSTLHHYERGIVNNSYETLYVFDIFGNLIFSKKGSKNQVRINHNDWFEILADNPRVFTHNHPSGSSFSGADLGTATEARIHEARAVGKKYIYSIKGFDNPRFKASSDEIVSAWKKIRAQILKRDLGKRNTIRSQAEAKAYNLKCSHETMLEFAKKYSILKYKRVLRNPLSKRAVSRRNQND